jgi:type I restriction enzyme S subunit
MSLTLPVSEIVSESDDSLLAIHPSWERVQLGAVATILNGFAFESQYFSNTSGMPLIRIRDVGNARTECSYSSHFDTRYVVKAGDLIVGMDGDFKCARWKGPEALLNQRVCKVELASPYYIPMFLQLALPGYLGAINRHTSSQTVRHLSSRSVAEIPLPLPPLAEQKRIVAKVEELFQHISAPRDRLANVQLILRRFRQAVLDAACSGRLTKNWRTEHPDLESAARLLNRIDEKSKRSRPPQHRTANFQEKETGGDMPANWLKSSSIRIFSVETGGTPLRKNPGYYRNGTIPWVKTGEVQNRDIWAAEEFVTPLALKETNVKVFPPGTILIAMYGEGKTRGQVARLQIEAATNQACAALVNPDLPKEMRDYVYYYSLSQYQHLREKAFGGNQPNLSLGVIKSWVINIPPLEEQREIVRRVEALFNMTDAIEKRVEAAAKRAEKLTQAILAKAFRGELVPTEAELARREGRKYESATELLESIRTASEKRTQIGGNRSRRGKPT